jgi:hypothetical protein
MAPVDDKQEESHAKQAIDDFNHKHDVDQHFIPFIVVDGVLCFFLFFVFQNPLESAIKDHGQRSTSLNVGAISLQSMNRVRQPSLALFLT